MVCCSIHACKLLEFKVSKPWSIEILHYRNLQGQPLADVTKDTVPSHVTATPAHDARAHLCGSIWLYAYQLSALVQQGARH